MRGRLRASPVASRASIAAAAKVAIVLVTGASLSCARPAPRVIRRDEPPPPVLVVSEGPVALRTAAWMELHAWLAAAAREEREAELPDPELERAARAYARALKDDDRDLRLASATRALAACGDPRCAQKALAGSPFAEAFAEAWPVFYARRWGGRVEAGRGAVERARTATRAELDGVAVARRVAKDLDLGPGGEWPEGASPLPVVDVVVDAPRAGREALVRAVGLGARGTCFVKAKEDPVAGALMEALGAKREKKAEEETLRMQHARILDCVLGHAAMGMKGRMRDVLVRELGEEEGERAFEVMALHAVAAVVTAWEPKHVSALRQSAAAVEPRAMGWLKDEWAARMRGEDAAAFAARYAAAWACARTERDGKKEACPPTSKP